MTTLDEILAVKKGYGDERNSMGCSENWYSSYYAIANTFTEEELRAMSEKELANLDRLASAISDALY